MGGVQSGLTERINWSLPCGVQLHGSTNQSGQSIIGCWKVQHPTPSILLRAQAFLLLQATFAAMLGVRVLHAVQAWHGEAQRSAALRLASARLQGLLTCHAATRALETWLLHVHRQRRRRAAGSLLAAVAPMCVAPRLRHGTAQQAPSKLAQ